MLVNLIKEVNIGFCRDLTWLFHLQCKEEAGARLTGELRDRETEGSKGRARRDLVRLQPPVVYWVYFISEGCESGK